MYTYVYIIYSGFKSNELAIPSWVEFQWIFVVDPRGLRMANSKGPQAISLPAV